jgi:hypothetical protein
MERSHLPILPKLTVNPVLTLGGAGLRPYSRLRGEDASRGWRRFRKRKLYAGRSGRRFVLHHGGRRPGVGRILCVRPQAACSTGWISTTRSRAATASKITNTLKEGTSSPGGAASVDPKGPGQRVAPDEKRTRSFGCYQELLRAG